MQGSKVLEVMCQTRLMRKPYVPSGCGHNIFELPYWPYCRGTGISGWFGVTSAAFSRMSQHFGFLKVWNSRIAVAETVACCTFLEKAQASGLHVEDSLHFGDAVIFGKLKSWGGRRQFWSCWGSRLLAVARLCLWISPSMPDSWAWTMYIGVC